MSITARSLNHYQVEIQAGTHTFLSDEPVGIGEDTGPSPFNLLLGGLASCTIITLKMYAQRKGWPLEGIQMTVDLNSTETRTPDGIKKRSSVIETRFVFSGSLTPEQTARLEEIANRCPVHRTLTGDIQILSSVTDPQV